MYLLNLSNTEPGDRMTEAFTFHYVSIKSTLSKTLQGIDSKFTFHYVSIKSI